MEVENNGGPVVVLVAEADLPVVSGGVETRTVSFGVGGRPYIEFIGSHNAFQNPRFEYRDPNNLSLPHPLATPEQILADSNVPQIIKDILMIGGV